MRLSASRNDSTGGVSLARRAAVAASRVHFALRSGGRELGAYLATLRHYGANATLAITGATLGRHRDLVRYLSDRGVEFAVQGYTHLDYTRLSDNRQREQIGKALDAFAEVGIPVSGFRAPYLRFNPGTLTAVEHFGFDYVSNEAVSYEVLEEDSFPPSRWARFRDALDRSAATPSTDLVARPHSLGRLVELPVALPDDEMLIDRLGMVDGRSIGQVWAALVDSSYQRGDLLTLQVHPRTGAISRQALGLTLTAALEKSPPIWVTQLRDVAAWWKARDRFRPRVVPTGVGQWRVTVAEDPRIGILVRNVICPRADDWDDRYRVVDGQSCVVDGPVCPVIGLSSHSESLASFLSEEGYAIAVGAEPAQCSMYLDHPAAPTPSEQASIVDEIESSPAPLVRLARWPDRARSALVITGDVGALSLSEVVSGLWEAS